MSQQHQLRNEPKENPQAAGEGVQEKQQQTIEILQPTKTLGNTAPGASKDEWQHFDLLLGLTADLLPVVSNQNATISANSAMQGLGKTPSRYNANRQVAGIKSWTQYQASVADAEEWSGESDYGICLQTRRVRAIDVDVPDAEQAAAIRAFIEARYKLPVRMRSNSSKFLMGFECLGELHKRKFATANGIVEFLATGQQCIVAGTHPSGVRYEWDGGLPDDFPTLSLEQFEELWADLAAEFGIEAPTESKASTRAQKLADVAQKDPRAQHLTDKGMVKGVERDGRMHFVCPFEHEHTSDSGDSSTTYWPAHTGGYENGHYKCLHAHCEHREDHEFDEALGYVDAALLSEFEAIADAPSSIAAEPKRRKFEVVPIGECVKHRPPSRYLIKKVIPQAELVVMFGDSGSGKTFMALDMAMAIARGVDWRGHKVQQGRVVYVAAEDYNGVCDRAQAYAHQYGINLDDIPFGLVNAAPNLLLKPEALEIAKEIGKGAALVVIDTFAKSMPGGNENGGEDVGLALNHCKGIYTATNAVVLLIHHSGKDASKGARGWSGLRAAADAELEVIRAGDARAMSTTKQKNGPDGAEFGFKLLPVWLGEDEDGEDITSCVIEHVGGMLPKGNRKTGGRWQKLVQRVAHNLIGIDGSALVVDVLDEAVNQMPYDSTSGKKDSRRDSANRALRGLVESAVFCVNRGLITLPQNANSSNEGKSG